MQPFISRHDMSRFLGLGLTVAGLIFLFDQASKYWIVQLFWPSQPQCEPLNWAEAYRCHYVVMPFVDLKMAWNTGISYGLFQQNGDLGRYLLIGFSILASIGFLIWLTRAKSLILALSLALIIGGALGNALDRLVYGAVADFVSLHAFGYYWYIFNLADAAIVAGAVGLGYEFLTENRKMAVNGS